MIVRAQQHIELSGAACIAMPASATPNPGAVEQPACGAPVRLDIEHRGAASRVHVGRHQPVPPQQVDVHLVPRPPQERVADGEGRRGDAWRVVDGEDFGVGERVADTRLEAAPRAQGERRFKALRLRVRDVVGAVAAVVLHRPADGHDHVVVAVEEPRGVHDHEPARERLLEPGVDALAALRLQAGIVGERDFERVGRRMPVPALPWRRLQLPPLASEVRR